MEERLRFVARLLDGETMTDLYREFGISRKTGCKIFDRYKERPARAKRSVPPRRPRRGLSRSATPHISIAAVAARRAQEEFEEARNAEIDVSIAAITIPRALTFADMQLESFASVEVLEHPWQP